MHIGVLADRNNKEHINAKIWAQTPLPPTMATHDRSKNCAR